MAPTLRTSATERLRDQAGSMIIEALVAAAILLGGGLATISAFDSITRASHTSEREAEAVAIAEKQLELIVSKPYAQIANCALPATGTGRSDDPGSWIQGTQLFVARNFRPSGGYASPPPVDVGAANRLAIEPFAVSAAVGCVPPLEDASTAGVASDSKINHTKLFRFITYQSGQCAGTLATMVSGSLTSSSLLGATQTALTSTASADVSALCTAMGAQQAKRVTVAVVLNKVGNDAGLKYPVYVSTLIPDPNASLHAATSTVLG
jgi:hypothetical protein